MPAPTVTRISPPPTVYPDGPDGILRPEARVQWSGGVGPFDVLHEWDQVASFDSGALVQDSNVGASSPDTGVPPSDLGGGTWFYRVTVTDTDDAAFTTSSTATLAYIDPIELDRFLYLLTNVGVGFDPKDEPAGGWGPAPDVVGPDGANIEFDRYLYLINNVSVGFEPSDTPAGGWGPDPAQIAPDGFQIAFQRSLYLLAFLGVGFGPTDEPPGGWGPDGGPGDGEVIDFDRYLYLLANIDNTTPTPHIWYVFPTFGREGWEFRIIGYGFGDTQGTYTGTATLNGLGLSVLTWELIAATGSDRAIDPIADLAEPIHQEIRTSVPIGGSSGLVIVCTDGP